MKSLSHRPIDAAMRALHDEGEIARELRQRLEAVDSRRFHLHRTLMRIRFALDNTTSSLGLRAEIDAILRSAGYCACQREDVA